MASNIIQNTVPQLWSSANDDVIYTFNFASYPIFSITNEVVASVPTGKVRLSVAVPYDIMPVPGDYIYIQSNVYNGTYKVLTGYSLTTLTLDLAYISDVTHYTSLAYHLRIPTFALYKGYKTLEGYEVELPYTKVVDIKPSILYNISGLPYLSINVKGALKYIFNIVSNTVANSEDFSMFNAIRMEWDGITTDGGVYDDFTFVLNTSIKNSELTYDKISTGIYLTPIDKPLIASQGVSFASIIDFNLKLIPIVHKFINGIKQ